MRREVVLGIVVTLALFAGAPTKAGAGQSGDAATVKKSITLLQTATLGGASLEQGKYDAEITGGADATLVLKRDKKEVARARVKRNDLATPSKYDRVDLRVTDSGKAVATLYFKGDRGSFEVLDDQGVAIIEKP
jgi:hypothetical protein